MRDKKYTQAEKKKYDLWSELYYYAKTNRASITDRVARRRQLYKGTDLVKDLKKGGLSDKKTVCLRNMCFELIETQINNSVPAPKVTPRDEANLYNAQILESYLKSEIDRLQTERLNDKYEREVITQGTGFLLLKWDNTKTTPVSQGELDIELIPIENVYPQPGITRLEDAEYIFVEELVSVNKIKKLYNKIIPANGTYKDKNVMVTVYYLNEKDHLSRFAWVEDYVIFDEEDYELRHFRKCAECGEYLNDETECPTCKSKKIKWVAEEMETLTEDIVKGNPNIEGSEVVIAAKGTQIPYYKIKQLPFVLRTNISQTDSLYGISDIDVLENNQDSLNKVGTKIQENILKGGSIVTVPTGVNIPNTSDTLKIVKISDPTQMKSFNVFSVQANVQQDDIFQDRVYNFGRSSLGITDSYQGKRDPTAESGKAKEISAAQAAGRLESKRNMKNAAYADLYQLMFKFLLAYCDEPRTYTVVNPDGTLSEMKFNRYNFLDVDQNGRVYYNDRFLFSVDNASVLSTNRELMWKETVNNFRSGTFGNPADPQSLLLFWNTMDKLSYPLAKQALSSITQRMRQLPQEMQQAIMNDPEILKAVQQVLAMKANEEEKKNVQNNAE